MGWSSATEIIEELAASLIKEDVHPDVRRRIYVPMVAKLQEGDWDTENEALGLDPQLDHVLLDACPSLRPEDGS